MKIKIEADYKEKRVEEYPLLSDQIDALWKALKDVQLPPEAAEMRDRIFKIKSKYPKLPSKT